MSINFDCGGMAQTAFTAGGSSGRATRAALAGEEAFAGSLHDDAPFTGCPGGANDQPSTDVETWLLFQGQCLPHLISLFSDALCLTGHPDVATDLVAETYRHASRTFQDCQPEQPLAGLSEVATLAWLRRIMHACSCQHCLGELP